MYKRCQVDDTGRVYAYSELLGAEPGTLECPGSQVVGMFYSAEKSFYKKLVSIVDRGINIYTIEIEDDSGEPLPIEDCQILLSGDINPVEFSVQTRTEFELVGSAGDSVLVEVRGNLDTIKRQVVLL